MNKKMLAAAALSGLMVGALSTSAMANDTATEPAKAEKNKCKGHEKDKCKGHEKAKDKKASDKKDSCSGKNSCSGK